MHYSIFYYNLPICPSENLIIRIFPLLSQTKCSKISHCDQLTLSKAGLREAHGVPICYNREKTTSELNYAYHNVKWLTNIADLPFTKKSARLTHGVVDVWPSMNEYLCGAHTHSHILYTQNVIQPKTRFSLGQFDAHTAMHFHRIQQQQEPPQSRTFFVLLNFSN